MNGTTRRGRDAGRGWAYLGTAVGALASLAANIAHCYVPPPGAPAGWTPEFGAVISAMFWPVALLIAVEILARTRWPTGRWWVLARFAGLLPVALVAAVVSYRHLSALLHHYGEDTLTTMAGPAAVDGLMVMAAAALLASSTRHTPRPPVATTTPPPVPAIPARDDPPVSADVPPGDSPVPAPVPARLVNGGIPSGVIR
jgi:hypothetical protein